MKKIQQLIDDAERIEMYSVRSDSAEEYNRGRVAAAALREEAAALEHQQRLDSLSQPDKEYLGEVVAAQAELLSRATKLSGTTIGAIRAACRLAKADIVYGRQATPTVKALKAVHQTGRDTDESWIAFQRAYAIAPFDLNILPIDFLEAYSRGINE